MLTSSTLATCLLASTAAALNGYAPVRGPCPSGSLLRDASTGINPGEAAFVAQRYAQASKSLAAWLAKINPAFPVLAANQYPLLALADGGGGLRGYTISAGIHKAFDGQEPDAAQYSTSGLYQAFTYETGLSGSAIMLYSYVQNNWPLTSTLLNNLWLNAFANDLSRPPKGTQAQIANQQGSKKLAGYSTSLTDTWGRILSYGTFLGTDPGLTALISNFVSLTGFSSFARPYPIITAIGIEKKYLGCGLPPLNSTQYEITPHEFGSWELGVNTFIQTKYMGTMMSKGSPMYGRCTTGFDNAGWGAALSSSTFNIQCGKAAGNINGFVGPALGAPFISFLTAAERGTFGMMPNPFFKLSTAPRVNDELQLTLVDGGETIQVPPLWPLLYRPEIDTVIVSDNSADSPSNLQLDPNNPVLINLPSGVQIYNTYTQAQANNIGNRMPFIPNPDAFMAANYNKNPMTFFGCSLSPNSSAIFMIYLPNRPVVYNSDIQATVTQYDQNTTLGMIANGEAIATNNGDPNFATCLACGIMKRSAAAANAALPSACTACFQTYCATSS